MTSNRIHSREDKAFIAKEVTRRVLATERERERRQSNPASTLEDLLREAINLEQERLKKDLPGREAEKRLFFWNKAAEVLHHVPETEHERILTSIVRMYVEEIHGDFNPRLHSLATRVLPWFLKILFSRMSAPRLASLGKRLNLDENLIVTGPVEQIRRLADARHLNPGSHPREPS